LDEENITFAADADVPMWETFFPEKLMKYSHLL
jgi:hypothetical protein